jgi:hypothetical protein
MAAADTHAAIGELLETVFSVKAVPRLCKEGQMPFDLEDSLVTAFRRTGALCEMAVCLTTSWSARLLSTSQCPYLFLNPPSVPYERYRELFHLGVKQPSVKLTTHLHLVPGSRMLELYVHSRVFLHYAVLNKHLVKSTFTCQHVWRHFRKATRSRLLRAVLCFLQASFRFPAWLSDLAVCLLRTTRSNNAKDRSLMLLLARSPFRFSSLIV